MEREAGSVEVGAYLLQAGGEGGTLVRQRGGGEMKVEADALREAFDEPEAEERGPALAAEIDAADAATTKIERAAALCKGIAEGRALDPDQLALEVGTLLDCLERLDRRKEHKRAIQLARSLSTLLMLLKRWGSLLQTLRLALRAGEAASDEAAVAWAKHELGTLRLAAGDVERADRDLRRAREIRERIGDRQGLAATNRNMQALCERLRDMVRDEELVPRDESHRWSPRRALSVAAVSGLLFLAGVAAGTIAGDEGSEQVAGTSPPAGGGGGNGGTGGGGGTGGPPDEDEYTLAIEIVGEGGGSVYVEGTECFKPGCEIPLPAGSTVQFDFRTDEDSYLESFSGDCEEPNCTLTMDAPREVIANFALDQPEVVESPPTTTTETPDEESEEEAAEAGEEGLSP